MVHLLCTIGVVLVLFHQKMDEWLQKTLTKPHFFVVVLEAEN